MAMVVSPCGKKMTMTEFTKHIPKCPICAQWWMRRNHENRGS